MVYGLYKEFSRAEIEPVPANNNDNASKKVSRPL